MESPVELRPITILVGRTTTGKSSFLRTFPLLRQSLEERLNSPIMWNGRYVDFGDYSTSLGAVSKKDGISYNFGIEGLQVSNILQNYSKNLNEMKSEEQFIINRYSNMKVSLAQLNNKVFRKNIVIDVPEHNIELGIENSVEGVVKNLSLNGKKINPEFGKQFHLSNGNFYSPITTYLESQTIKNQYVRIKLGNYFMASLVTMFKEYTENESIQSIIADELFRFIENPILSTNRIDHLASQSNLKAVKTFYRDLKNNHNGKFDLLNETCQVLAAFATYEKLSEVWENLIRNSTYIGPTRANIRRYNLLDESDTTEIFFDGRNLPSFLSKLNKSQLESYSDWVKELFGFEITLEYTKGHISICTKENFESRNLVDTGSGISQIIPILTQIWWDTKISKEIVYRNRSIYDVPVNLEFESRSNTKLVAIEEPELHLHPAHQASLANMFVNAISDSRAREGGLDLIFVIETHSEALVSRLGYLIKKGQISPDDVQILIFSKEEDNKRGGSEIRTSHFHEDGYLINWPYGFFGY